MEGKTAVRLSSHYQLGCDFGTALMFARENGRNPPVYLCESHANQVGLSDENGKRVLELTEHPTNSVRSGGAADAQVRFEKEPVAVAVAPASNPAAGDAAEVLAHEAIGDMPPENFEAYGTAFKLPNSSATTQETQAGESELVHICSRYGERCTYEATVHCPKCGKWFCDAHAEDRQWHPCALTRLEN